MNKQFSFRTSVYTILTVLLFGVGSLSAQSNDVIFTCSSTYGENEYSLDNAMPVARNCFANLIFEQRSLATGTLIAYKRHTLACHIPANQTSCTYNETPYSWYPQTYKYVPIELVGGQGVAPNDAYLGNCVKSSGGGFGGSYVNNEQRIGVSLKYHCNLP